MTKTLFRFVIFIFVLFVLDRTFFFGLDALYERSHLTDFLRRRPEIVFMGDSKFHFGIDPSLIEKNENLRCYNAAHEAGGLVFSRGLQAAILSRWTPKMFVLETMDLSSEKAAAAALAPFFKNKEVRDLLRRFEPSYWFRYHLLKSARFNARLLRILKAQWTSTDSNTGYKALHGYHPRKDTVPPNSINVTEATEFAAADLIDEFIEAAKSKGVRVVIVEMPLRNKRHSRSYNLFKTAALKHQVKWLDFSKEGEDFVALADRLFYDDEHLNHEGAAVFSDFFYQKLRLKENLR